MNLAQIKKNVGQRVQLVPVACRLDAFGQPLPQINDPWLVSEVTDEGVRIENPRTAHFTILGLDHIHHFTSNPDATRHTGIAHGFFTLHVQLFIQGPRVWITPTLRPGEDVAPAQVRISVEKRVDADYPIRSGLQERLEAQGFDVAWCGADKLTQMTEYEGWELVVAETKTNGKQLAYQVRNEAGDQFLIKKVRAQ